MMGFIKWTKALGRCLLYLFFVLLTQAESIIAEQEGFVSLQCCAPSNFIDPNTKIRWTSDIEFQNSGNCHNLSTPEANDSTYNLARIFGTSSENRWCYNLPTVQGHNYLLRGTFVPSSYMQTTPNTSFDILLGATTISSVNSSVDSLEVESIFSATDDYTNFCIVRRSGNPYLSKLELRPLSGFRSDQSSVLKVVTRVDVGNTQGVIRYPYDQGDRIWNVRAKEIENATWISNLNVGVIGANTTVPLEVLQTAVTDPERLDFLYENLGEANANYLIYLYFLELNVSVGVGERVFDIYVNGEKEFEKFDISGNGTASNYREVVWNVTAIGILNVSLIKSDEAVLGPICNAYEIFEMQKWIKGTQQQDVDAIVKLRDELLVENGGNEVLGSWSGDPCLPLPWEGLLCHSFDNESFVITNLDLSSNALRGPLPPVITELTHLMHLNLSFNHLTGTIPPFPLSSLLMLMDVSHNDFAGAIPGSLASLPHLSRLDVGCNPHLGNVLPSILSNQSNIITDSGTCAIPSSSRSKRHILIGSLAGGSLLLTVAVGAFFICIYRKRLLRRLDGEDQRITKHTVFSIPSQDDLGFKSISVQAFTLECIEIATNKYKTLIGEGGFGSVYRGTLPDGNEVAVKVRSATSTQGTREFENELNLLSAMWHENLVPLIGYCCESEQQILVYPFMSNGSLQDRLYGDAAKRKILDWPTRLSIALGAARGLQYLHTFAGRCIIHRDVKSSNILLDHRMTARVADFGFSKYAPQEGDSGASLEVRGTAGYLDPEYYSTQHLSAKSDVFSFGVVLLEIISGREPLDIHRPRNEWSLVEWAKPLVRDSRIEDIVDPNIKAGYHMETMWRVVEVALTCIEPFSAYRPCMADIVRELEDALIIENNASEYMKSIDSFGGSSRYLKSASFGGSNRYSPIEKKIILPATPSPVEPSPIISQALAPPQPR